MKYTIKRSDSFTKSMKKLKKKDKLLFQRIQKKSINIVENPERFKHLGNVLAGFSRIQFGPFILVFKIKDNIIKFISLDHHDKAY